VLKEISALKTRPLSIWIQPGATDAQCLKYITDSELSPICIYSKTSLPTPAPASQKSLAASDMSEGTDTTPPGCDAIGALVHPSITDDHINVDGTVSQSDAPSAALGTRTRNALKRDRSPTPNPRGTRDGPHAAAEDDRRPTKMPKTENNAPFPYDQTMLSKVREFSTFQKVAVVGANNTTTKMGTRIFQAILNDGKTAIPVNNDPVRLFSSYAIGIRCADAELGQNMKIVDGKNVIPDLATLEDPSNTAVSIVIPPNQTYKVLQEIVNKSIAIPVIWLQPGSQDQQVINYIKNTQGLQDRCIWTTGSSSGSTNAPKSQDGPLTPKQQPTCPLGPSALDLFSGLLTTWIPAAVSAAKTAATKPSMKTLPPHGPCILQRLLHF
jgi:predicted CoA-binding protein